MSATHGNLCLLFSPTAGQVSSSKRFREGGECKSARHRVIDGVTASFPGGARPPIVPIDMEKERERLVLARSSTLVAKPDPLMALSVLFSFPFSRAILLLVMMCRTEKERQKGRVCFDQWFFLLFTFSMAALTRACSVVNTRRRPLEMAGK